MSLLIILGFLTVFAGNVAAQQVICYAPTYYDEYLDNLDATTLTYCTHYTIAFASVDSAGKIVAPKFYGKYNLASMVSKLKSKGSKVLLGVGGWSSGTTSFSIVAASSSLRSTFVQNCMNYVTQYGLDGIDIDWEFPAKAWTNGRDDPTNFVSLLRDLRAGLNKLGTKILTTAVGASEWSVISEASYKFTEVASQVNYIILMTYDYHMDADWDTDNGVYFNAPLTDSPTMDSVERSVKFWTDAGVSTNKIVLGLPFYSRTYKLANPSQTYPTAPYVVRDQSVDHERYVVAYRLYCKNFDDYKYTKVFDTQRQVPYMYNSTHWISYENDNSIARKTSFAKSKGLAGVKIWSLDQDDYLGNCDGGCKWRLLKAANHYQGKTWIHC